MLGASVSSFYGCRAQRSANDLLTANAMLKQSATKERAASELASARATEATNARKQAVTSLARSERELELARRRIYTADMQIAGQAFDDEDLTTVLQILDRYIPAAANGLAAQPPVDLRGWEWYYLRSRCDTGEIVLRGHAQRVESVAWRFDGQELASADASGQILIWDLKTAMKRLTLLYGESRQCELSWSDHLLLARQTAIERYDQRTKMRAGAATIKVYDTTNGKEVLSSAGPDAAWSRRGGMLALLSSENQVLVWDSKSQQTREIAKLDTAPTAIAWSVNNKELYLQRQPISIFFCTVIGFSSGMTQTAVSGIASKVTAAWLPTSADNHNGFTNYRHCQ